AEDGIRVLYVTGVQTCALPISQGGEGVVGDLARPRQVPQRVQHGDICGPAGGLEDLAEERGAALAKVLADALVDGLRGWLLGRQIGRASCRERWRGRRRAEPSK